MMESFTTEERVVMRADLNGHVGEANNGIERIRGVHGYGRTNRNEERVVDLAVSFDLILTSIFFSKREENREYHEQ